ncbi:hypothetical protein E2C01_096039 [Portunus trituberculatus]|uniref:Uncharacterized protein n=1 Tax=Portunus trituberculatus TaxID=210409 RepID=A0A5B7K5V7_PORTR|nr:hypothetical protein [Portunus trituberculatus]
MLICAGLVSGVDGAVLTWCCAGAEARPMLTHPNIREVQYVDMMAIQIVSQGQGLPPPLPSQ